MTLESLITYIEHWDSQYCTDELNMAKGELEDKQNEFNRMSRCKALYEYLTEHFNAIHEILADLGKCDSTGGCEYSGVFKSWITLGCPQPIEAFIVWGSNGNGPLTLEKFNKFCESYTCLFKNDFDINAVYKLQHKATDDIVSIQKVLDKAIQECKSIINDINRDITTQLDSEEINTKKRSRVINSNE